MLASLLGLLSLGGNAMAQVTSTNCVRVICPPQVVTNFTCTSVYLPTSYPIVISNLCVPPAAVTVNCNPPLGTPLTLGPNPVNCVVLANGAVVGQCQFVIIVERDTTPPTIRCPSNIVAQGCQTAAGGCSAIVNYPPPVASDNSGVVTLSCAPPSGSPFPCGVTTVMCVAVDPCTNRAQCQFTVTVQPGAAPPTIQCPPDLTLTTCSNCAVLNYPPPTVIGGTAVTCTPPPTACLPPGVHIVTCVAQNPCGSSTCTFKVTVLTVPPPRIECPTNPIVVTVPCGSTCVPVIYPAGTILVSSGTFAGCTPPSGTCLPVGIHTVTCFATNDCGLRDTCSFDVRVIQGQGNPPQITCPSNIVVSTCSNCEPVTFTVAVGNGVLLGCNPPSGFCFPLGVTTVTCRATNPCASATCTFTVTVRPVPPPSIQCPTNPIVVTVPCGSNCVPVVYPTSTIVVSSGTFAGCTPPSGTCLPVGIHTVTCSATNECGARDTCSFDVRVIQGQGNPPQITCPSNIVVSTCSNCEPVTFTVAVGNGALLGCAPPSGFCFPLGVTTVTCRATNPCASATCTFTVTVRPVPPPSIQCPTNPIVVTVPCGSTCVPVVYPTSAIVVSSGTFAGCNPPSGTCLPVGIHTVTCSATNECGLKDICSFDVRVIQGQGNPPQITCPSNIVVTTCSNCTPVTFTVPVGNGALVGCNPPSGFCFPLGVTAVTCVATNPCGTATCTFTVTVRPVPPPSIVCPSNIVVSAPCGSNCVPVSYPAPVVLSGALVGCTPPSGFCFPLGATVVTCRAINGCGQVTGCDFTVLVLGSTGHGPIITCPSNIVLTTCTNCEVVNYPLPTVVNGVLVGCTPPPTFCFPVGATVVTCVASNACGISDCRFTVTVAQGRPCVKPPLNMVLWLPFDEPVGPIARNIVPGAPNGGHIGGPAPLLGQWVLNSLCFDGVNDFVRVPNYAAIQLGFQNFSIDTWAFRQDTGGRRVIASKISQVAGGIAGYEFYLQNGNMNLLLRTPLGAFNFSSGVIVPPNGWHFLTVTVQRAGVPHARFYLDGVLVAVVNGGVPGSVSNGSSLFAGAGTFPVGSYWRGYLDELEIFNRILTPAEITSLWNAGRAGKCKIKCWIPWDVAFRPGSNYVTVQARIWNCSAVPVPITWVASGPMPFPIPGGTFVLPPFTCTNFPISVCRPTNGQPVGRVVVWNLSVYSGLGCPIVCMGSVINPGPIVVNPLPDLPITLAGTNRTGTVRIGLNGLPPGQPVRLRAIGPDMEPDLVALSLNGLPPGQPVIIGGGAGAGGGAAAAPTPGGLDFPLSFRFVEPDPIGAYTILLETDLDGDGAFDTLASFDTENPVVAPPEIRILPSSRGYFLDWDDKGDGFGTLQHAREVEGPWLDLPGGAPGYPVNLSVPMEFFRIAVPTLD